MVWGKRQPQVGQTLADLFPPALREKADKSPTNDKTLRRGDVVWVEGAQYLSNAHNLQAQAKKFRPFVVLDQALSYHEDRAQQCCADPLTLLCVEGTTQPHLVRDRACASFHIPGGAPTTYAMLDSLRTLNGKGHCLEPVYRLTEDELKAVCVGLDTILQPEPKFHLKIFGTRLHPGDVWDISTAAGDTTALILLRRGRLASFASAADEVNGIDPSVDFDRPKVPYLVVSLREQCKVTNLRGIKWADLDLMSVQEGAFIKRRNRLTDETVGILLNNLRGRIGLPAITYKAPVMRSAFNFALWPVLIRKFRL